MEHTSSLYDTLVQVLSQHANWLDFRHLKTLAWMMVGLIHSSSISLCAWTPFVVSRAQYSQSTVRRFRRWLDNEKMHIAPYGRTLHPSPLAQGPARGAVEAYVPRLITSPSS